jgi:hypothetical protein
LLFEPGTQYRYSSYGWIVVSAAAALGERASVQPTVLKSNRDSCGSAIRHGFVNTFPPGRIVDEEDHA